MRPRKPTFRDKRPLDAEPRAGVRRSIARLGITKAALVANVCTTTLETAVSGGALTPDAIARCVRLAALFPSS